MTKYEINILRKALLKVEQKELNYFKNLPRQEVEFSEEFESKIQNLAKKRKTFIWQATKTVPRRVALIFAAVIMTFCLMMTISAIRIPVVNFFVNIYEEFISIFIDEEEGYVPPEKIETIALPSYMFIGYTLDDSQNYGKDAESFWSNENGDVVILYQQVLETEFQSFIDNQDLEFQQENTESITLHYSIKNRYYQIFWSKNGYLFSLTCPENIPLKEVKEMIISIN